MVVNDDNEHSSENSNLPTAGTIGKADPNLDSIPLHKPNSPI